MSEQQPTNQNLIEQIRSGDQVLIKKLYNQFKDEFLIWLQQKHQAELHQAKDMYQLSFVVLLRNIQTRKLTALTSELKTYLFAIGRNLWRSYQRKNQNIDLVKNDLIFDRVEEDNSSEDFLQKREGQLKLIAAAFRQIGDPCKTLLEHFYYGNLSMAEIVEEMNYKNVNTVKTQKHRCLQRFKKLIQNNNN